MNVASEKQTERTLFTFWRRSESWLEISGYHAGDIHSDQPVLIEVGATVVGNVLAPQVVVAGLLNGSLIARKTAVKASGQIWGDIYTISLDVTPGGRVQGWITTLDDESYPRLLDKGAIPETSPPLLPVLDEDNNIEMGGRPASSDQIYALRYLQAEAATAMAARAELEQSFERRLTEVAGESTAKVHSLHEELDAARSELNELRLRFADAEESLRARELRLKRQNNELSTTRVLLTERNRELNELRRTTTEQDKINTTLQGAKTRLEQSLLSLQEELERANGRLHSLEGALQANLQHSAEQEESLIRWQELAEVTQRQVEEAESQLAKTDHQLAQSNQINEMLREQRQQLEEEWQRALDELDALREAQMATVEEAKQTAVSPPAIDPTQLLWDKTNRHALEEALSQAHQRLNSYESELANLKTALLANQSQADAERDKLQTRLTKYETQWKQQLTQLREKSEVEKQIMQASLQDLEEKRQRSEIELDAYYQQVRQQGNELAASRAALVDKDLEIQAWQQKAAQQAKKVQHIKQSATTYITNIQKQLAQSQRQVQDLTQLLERKIKKPSGD